MITNRVWPLVIVGQGSSAAYYLCTVDLSQYPAILAIGDGDAWSTAVRGHHGSKGDPTLYINHPLHLIAHFGKTIPGFSTEKVDRLDWAEMNKGIFNTCGVTLYSGKVKKEGVSEVSIFPNDLKVEDDLGPSGFKLTLNDNQVIHAHKVVMAAGAGGHRIPDKTVEEARNKWPKQVLDLDEFARMDQNQFNKDKKIIVMGPNAAIDAVQKALHYNCKIYWLLGPNDEPPVLATQPAVKTAMQYKKSMIHRYKSIQFKHPVGGELCVRLDSGTVLYGNYFVYGMGQTGETVNVISESIRKKLTPIYDKNQYLGSGSDTILGYEAIGTGLKKGFEVVGAMSAQVGRSLLQSQKQSLECIEELIEKTRSIENIHVTIQSAGFQVKPFLLKNADFVGKLPRQPLIKQLQQEMDFVMKKHRDNLVLRDGLNTLCNLLLAYQAASSMDKVRMQKQLNQVTHDLPKGAVADSGQLTSIRSAMAAKHNTVPQYVGGQRYEGNSDKKSKQWVPVNSTPGDVNFSIDNATMIQIALSIRYPFISDADLNKWVSEKIEKRRNTGIGFTGEEVSRFHSELSQMNQRELQKLSRL